jgi:hypothetical protein
LLVITMVFALSGIAKADNLDFHMVVVDAGTPASTIYLVPPPSPVTFQFDPCNPLLSPTADGCAYFVNLTGSTLTNLTLVLPDSGNALGQMPNLDQSGFTTLAGGPETYFFTQTQYSISGGNYILSFSGGSILNDQAFTIAENGVDVSATPWTGTLTTTPEPNSIWLLSTGAMMLGAFFYYKRRNGLGDQRL